MRSRQKHTPTLNDLLDYRIKQIMAGMFCNGIGTIQAFDATTQQATISINYKRKVKDYNSAKNNVDRVDKIFEYPLLLKCPLIFLTGGASRLTMPVAVGDTCVVFFNDRDIDVWLETGIAENPPNSERIHSIADAIAVVGIRSNADPLSDFNTQISSLIDKTGERLTQAGDVKATARATAPSGWLLCYGQALSREDYDILFDAIGTIYGAGDGSTTFNVPDARGRGIVGLDNMGGSNADVLTTAFNPNRNTLGGEIGEESHLLTGKESGIQLHDHDLNLSDSATSTRAQALGRATTNAGTDQTEETGHTDAIDEHQNVPPSLMLNIIIKY